MPRHLDSAVAFVSWRTLRLGYWFATRNGFQKKRECKTQKRWKIEREIYLNVACGILCHAVSTATACSPVLVWLLCRTVCPMETRVVVLLNVLASYHPSPPINIKSSQLSPLDFHYTPRSLIPIARTPFCKPC